jgi:hypothetical protein
MIGLSSRSSIGRSNHAETSVQYPSLLVINLVRGVGCQWRGDPTLEVKAKTCLPFLGPGALPIPPEDKQAIDELLQKLCLVWDCAF